MTGKMIYTNWKGERRTITVRDCPDPAKARLALEELVGPTRWEAS